MESLPNHCSLPDSQSPELGLDHPTTEENVKISTNTSVEWKHSLSVRDYLKECLFLETVPLAKDGGLTTWILVDKNLTPDQRPILCSCESFRKRSLVSDSKGNVADTIVHGIASVFCPPAYRRRGFAKRMMTELSKALRSWQVEYGRCVGSILYSDIGKSYYSKIGWQPTPTNNHLVLKPSESCPQDSVKEVSVQDLLELCEKDELMIRRAMATAAEGAERRVTILPDIDHVLWHITREEFVCQILFDKVPHAKGAIAGSPGSRIWSIWTHRYNSPPNEKLGDNTLYILRLVFEKDPSGNSSPECHEHGEQVDYLKAILEAAQNEAALWNLDQVKLWHPTPLIEDLIGQCGIEHSAVEREEEKIASGLWYDENDDGGVVTHWVNNEYYAWC